MARSGVKIRVGSTDYEARTDKVTSPALQLSGGGSTVYGCLTTTKPSTATLSFNNGGATYYLNDAGVDKSAEFLLTEFDATGSNNSGGEWDMKTRFYRTDVNPTQGDRYVYTRGKLESSSKYEEFYRITTSNRGTTTYSGETDHNYNPDYTYESGTMKFLIPSSADYFYSVHYGYILDPEYTGAGYIQYRKYNRGNKTAEITVYDVDSGHITTLPNGAKIKGRLRARGDLSVLAKTFYGILDRDILPL